MSYPARAWAEAQPLQGWIKAVLFILADACSKTGECRPSVKIIGTRLGISRKTVGRQIKGLIALQLITRRRHWKEPTSYVLHLDRTTPSDWEHVVTFILASKREHGAHSLQPSEWERADQRMGTRVPQMKSSEPYEGATAAPVRERRPAYGETVRPEFEKSLPIAARASAVLGTAPTHGSACEAHEAQQDPDEGTTRALMLRLVADAQRGRRALH